MQIFLYRGKFTTFVISSIILDCPGNFLLKRPERLLGNLLFSEVFGNDLLNDFGDIFVSFGEIFIELIHDHGSKLFSLLYCGCVGVVRSLPWPFVAR